jgi:hypothetical protein
MGRRGYLAWLLGRREEVPGASPAGQGVLCLYDNLIDPYSVHSGPSPEAEPFLRSCRQLARSPIATSLLDARIGQVIIQTFISTRYFATVSPKCQSRPFTPYHCPLPGL